MVEKTKCCSQKWKSPEHLNMLIHKGKPIRTKRESLINSYKTKWGDFAGGPVVKTLLSNAGDAGSIPGWETRVPCTTGHCN